MRRVILKSLKISIPLYRWTVNVHFVEDIYAKYFALGGDEELINSEALTYTVADENTIHVIFDQNPSHVAIGHEIMHVTDDILSSRNIHLHIGTEEVYAYMVGYLLGEIYDHIEINSKKS